MMWNRAKSPARSSAFTVNGFPFDNDAKTVQWKKDKLSTKDAGTVE